MYQNKRNLDRNPDFIPIKETPKNKNQNSQHGANNNEFLSLNSDQDNSSLKLPVIKKDRKPIHVKRPSPKEIRQAEIHVEYRGKGKEEEKERDKVKGREQNKMKVDSIKEGRMNNRTQRDRENSYDTQSFQEDIEDQAAKTKNQDNKMSHYLSLNESSLKPSTKEITTKGPSNPTRLFTVNTQAKSLFKSNSRTKFLQRKSRQSLPNWQDQAAPSRKYMAQVERHFAELDFDKLEIEDVERQNDKVRVMIRKLNTELNQIIDRVALLQKRSTQRMTVEKSIKLLEESLKNNQKVIERGHNEIRKLEEKVGCINKADYEDNTTTEILHLKEAKRELQKEIVQSKALNTMVSKKSPLLIKKSTEITKNDLVHLKKEVERHQARDEQLLGKLEEVQQKSSSLDRRYVELVQAAESKGVSIQSTASALAKQKQLEQKQKQLKKAIQNISTLYKSKVDIASNENQRIKRNIANTEAQIRDIYAQTVDYAGRSSLLIENERENPRLFKNVLRSLETFSRSIANPPNVELGRIGVESRLEDKKLQEEGKMKSRSESERFKGGGEESGVKQQHSNKPRLKLNKNSSSERRVVEGSFQKQIMKQKQKSKVQLLQPFEEDSKPASNTKQIINTLKPTFNLRKKQESQPELNTRQVEEMKMETLTVKPFQRALPKKESKVEQQGSKILASDNKDKEIGDERSKESGGNLEGEQRQAMKKFVLKRKGSGEKNKGDGEYQYLPLEAVPTRDIAKQEEEPKQQKQQKKLDKPSGRSSNELPYKQPLISEDTNIPLNKLSTNLESNHCQDGINSVELEKSINLNEMLKNKANNTSKKDEDTSQLHSPNKQRHPKDSRALEE